jgi:hypothetical protein
MDRSVADDGSSDLATFLATFDALSTKVKAKALQHLAHQQRGETSKFSSAITKPTSSAFAIQNAHSCHICQVLIITLKPRDERDERFDSNNVVLTKETLKQSIARKCVLVKWLFTLLTRGLLDLKTMVAKTSSLPSHAEAMRDVTDDLQYISSEGVVISCYGVGNTESDEVVLRLNYEIDPFLIDKTWNAAYDADKGWSYEAFASRYTRRLTARSHISASAGEFCWNFWWISCSEGGASTTDDQAHIGAVFQVQPTPATTVVCPLP